MTFATWSAPPAPREQYRSCHDERDHPVMHDAPSGLVRAGRGAFAEHVRHADRDAVEKAEGNREDEAGSGDRAA